VAAAAGTDPPTSTRRISIIGPDVYDLDRDGDGIACESH
jgi:hypothetical protein